MNIKCLAVSSDRLYGLYKMLMVVIFSIVIIEVCIYEYISIVRVCLDKQYRY